MAPTQHELVLNAGHMLLNSVLNEAVLETTLARCIQSARAPWLVASLVLVYRA